MSNDQEDTLCADLVKSFDTKYLAAQRVHDCTVHSSGFVRLLRQIKTENTQDSSVQKMLPQLSLNQKAIDHNGVTGKPLTVLDRPSGCAVTQPPKP
jgi:hypothetical protein